MPSQGAKTYFAMPRGLNTEAPLINFPEGYTMEEQNYELQLDGSRRRRLGIALETGGEVIEITEGWSEGDPIRTFDWETAAGIPTLNFLVMQVGYFLKIFEDTSPTSPTDTGVSIDIRPFAQTDATDAQVASWPLESANGRGHLFLFGKYTDPFYIEYNPDTESFTATGIQIMERDFKGKDDAIEITTQPNTLTDTHEYNLRNRGWTDLQIGDYFVSQSKYPSKAMIPYLGLKRALTSSDAYDLDGVRSFSPSKLVAELFQDASAPTGHIIKSPFSTSTVDGDALSIISWDLPVISGGSPPISTTPGLYPVTFTLDGPHGASVSDTVHISYTAGDYNTTPGFPINPVISFQGDYVVTAVPTANSFTVNANYYYDVSYLDVYPWYSWSRQYMTLGSVTSDTLPDPTGEVIDFRPKAGAFFAGRCWYSGIDTARLGGRVYFSQVIEDDSQYGKCYQVADPTDERISDLVASDGGVIPIPEAGNVLKLVPYSHSLLVFATNGVWEIGPGADGYFTAVSYSVRKITDSGAVSPGSVVLIDNLPIFWSTTDIYVVEQNEQTGYLQTRNISQTTINTFYNNIPLDNRRESIGVYDDLKKRVVWLYRDESTVTNTYDKGLVYDARLNAFTPMSYAFDTDKYIRDIIILKEAGEVSKVKYVGVLNEDSVINLYIGEANDSTTYKDFGISESDCYLITGAESAADPASFKEAPYVTVFSRKTETGYGPAPDYEAVRPSSTYMRSRWDWADNSSASKWGEYKEVYRRPRTYIPSNPTTDTFDDGAPIVVTKNAIRGRGRVVQLEFRAGTGKDSWINGWKTNFIMSN